MPKALILCLALALPASSWAAVYKWVDAQGTTHYGDSVPREFAKRSKQIDTDADVSTPAGITRSGVTTPSDAQPAGSLFGGPSVSDSDGLSRTDSEPPGNTAAACRDQWRRYEQSSGCFQRFRLANGTVRPEAYRVCTEVASPTCELP
jgi:hypothetical protein